MPASSSLRTLLRQGGAEMPTIELLYNTNETHKDIAEVLADTWKRELGLNAKHLNQEWKVYLDTQRTISFDVSREESPTRSTASAAPSADVVTLSTSFVPFLKVMTRASTS